MRRVYRYSYQTVVSYDSMVSHHHFLLRCRPMESSHQRLASHDLQYLSQVKIKADMDCFGNPIYYGEMIPQHDIFVVASSGVVECEPYRVEEVSPSGVFLSQSQMTHMSTELQHFSRGVETDSSLSPVDQALALCYAIYTKLSYAAGVTSIYTTASQSFELGVGVCQDFAHILISLCRARGIYARYVVGFLLGEGETHAWVEVYGTDGAWYGIDPTHNSLIEHEYIKIAHGRDALDCSVTRGVHRGGSAHTTQVRVLVESIY